MLVLLLQLSLILSCLAASENLKPNLNNTVYNIAEWTQQLNLQKCAIVQIGNDFCSLFLESEKDGVVVEYFLGVCECKTMVDWQWCSSQLTKQRPKKCSFEYDSVHGCSENSRVHRRFCDVTSIAEWGDSCNCSKSLNGNSLVDVSGFPTCAMPSLPESICSPRNVCGTSKCSVATVAETVYTVVCNPRCYQKQPFCEKIGPETSKKIVIEGSWTEFSVPACVSGILISTSRCIDSKSSKPAFDCLGPGTMCCLPNNNCTCSISHQNGFLTVTRTTSFCSVTK